MAVEFIINRLKTLFLLVFGAFRRAMCCLRRRRRSSCDSVPLSAVGVIPNNIDNNAELQQWEKWEENPVVVVAEKPINPIQAKIQEYRQQAVKPLENNEENHYNYFEDMTPKITKQMKVLIKNKTNTEETLNPTKFDICADPVPTSELGEWEENSKGWESQTLEEFGDITIALREERRKERERKLLEQHQRRVERNYRPSPLGAKISS